MGAYWDVIKCPFSGRTAALNFARPRKRNLVDAKIDEMAQFGQSFYLIFNRKPFVAHILTRDRYQDVRPDLIVTKVLFTDVY